MSAFTNSSGTITLAPIDYDSNDANSYNGWHISAPLLFGFVTPMALAVSFNHRWLAERPILLIMLVGALAISFALFAAGLLCSGEVKAAVFDPRQKLVALVRHNPFATSTWHIAYNRIAEVKSVIHYDQYGRKTLQPELVLTSGSRVALPSEIGRRELEAARATIERYRAQELPPPQRQRAPRQPGRRAR